MVSVYAPDATGSAARRMIRPMFSGAKNAGGGSVPAMTLTKSSIVSWLPWTAASSCCISGGGGSIRANSQVRS